MTNYYLYGQAGTPINYNDRIRPANALSIAFELDMGSYLANGAGKYFTPATMPVVRDLFDIHTREQNYNLSGLCAV